MQGQYWTQLKLHVNNVVGNRRSQIVQDLHAAALSSYATQCSCALEHAKAADRSMIWAQVEEVSTR